MSFVTHRYWDTMRRRNYVTPTSYLELIKTFKILLNKKRLELLTLKDRYVVGLEKLQFSESQVRVQYSVCTGYVLVIVETAIRHHPFEGCRQRLYTCTYTYDWSQKKTTDKLIDPYLQVHYTLKYRV